MANFLNFLQYRNNNLFDWEPPDEYEQGLFEKIKNETLENIMFDYEKNYILMLFSNGFKIEIFGTGVKTRIEISEN